MISMSEEEMNKVDTRFWVTLEAEIESEERGDIAGAYTTDHWQEYRNLPEETRNQVYYFLWDNYQLEGLMEMSFEEVLALAQKDEACLE
ncbi:MAG: hypothetical protein NC413_14955 [Muribaculum sp.]|nr:hypothetical protein [Muribaculum sp.]